MPRETIGSPLGRITETRTPTDQIRDDDEKTMVWRKGRADFPGFNATHDADFPTDQPARPARISDFLVESGPEIDAFARKPLA